MSNVHPLPTTEVVEREASEWLALFASDAATAEDRARFRDWQNAHALHAKTYAAMRTVWQDSVAAGPLVRAVSFGQSMNAASQARPSNAARWYAAAAAVAIATLGAAWFYETRPLIESFETAVGERATILLPDGTSLEINSHTRAEVRYERHARVVRLVRGESFFNVVHDSERPFQVETDGMRVRDIGTAFNVDLRDSGARVTVSDGRVDITASGEGIGSSALAGATVTPTTLSRGEQATLQGRVLTVRQLSGEELARLTAWRTGTLNFEREPLADVVAEMSRYTTTPMIVTDPAIGRVPIGGTFPANAKGAQTLMQMLRDGLDIPVRQVDQTIYIGAPPVSK